MTVPVPRQRPHVCETWKKPRELMTDSVRLVPAAAFYLLYPLGLSYLALMRPPEGLFSQPELTSGLRDVGVDGRFKSGLDLFMVQSHQLAALTNGDNCAYPTFDTRLKAARAFQKDVLDAR